MLGKRKAIGSRRIRQEDIVLEHAFFAVGVCPCRIELQPAQFLRCRQKLQRYVADDGINIGEVFFTHLISRHEKKLRPRRISLQLFLMMLVCSQGNQNFHGASFVAVQRFFSIIP